MYHIVFRTDAARELRKLPTPIRQQMIILIDSLAGEPRPHGVNKLVGIDAWRVRLGDYRIVYSIQDSQVLIEIIKIGNRRDVYR